MAAYRSLHRDLFMAPLLLGCRFASLHAIAKPTDAGAEAGVALQNDRYLLQR
jgi:hypothetical protein